MPKKSHSNWIRCKYCTWQTSRFRGHKLVGEGWLRLHVVESHKDEYLHQQGLESTHDDGPWTRDVADIGEQAL